MQLQLTPYNAHSVTWNNRAKWGAVDASDLWRGRGFHFSQLYDDAADIGIALHNPQTGSTTVWHWSEDYYDTEGELSHCILRPTYETVRKYPALEGYRLNIYND